MIISVSVHPNSKNPKVVREDSNKFKVYVNQPAIEGRANQAVIEALAKHLKTKKSKIFLVSGEKSKNKIFEILS